MEKILNQLLSSKKRIGICRVSDPHLFGKDRSLLRKDGSLFLNDRSLFGNEGAFFQLKWMIFGGGGGNPMNLLRLCGE